MWLFACDYQVADRHSFIHGILILTACFNLLLKVFEMVYSTAERVEIVSIWYRNNDCAKATARIFNANHPDKSVSHQYVKNLMDKFVATGSVLNKKREKKDAVQDEGVEVAVLGHFQMNNNQSIKTVSQASGVSSASIYRILKKYKFHPYKMNLVQELHEDDYDRRIQFCEYFTEQLQINPNLLYNTCFSDECTFMLNGEVNRHNCRYWSDTNPHLIRECNTQTPQKLNVWAGIFGNHLVGPIFIEGNLNGDMYLNLLENIIYPQMIDILENDNNLLENEITFQHDGAPPHFAVAVRQFLDRHFAGRWIGRRGAIEWPPRSPDLTPLDFFLWGHLKSRVYVTQPETLEVLRYRIIQECRLITPEIFNNVRSAFQNRLYYCLQFNGGHFEHVVNEINSFFFPFQFFKI